MPAPAADSRLFTAEDLVFDDISDAEAAIAESVVWGWLKPVLGLATRPEPVTDELFAWALELGAIYIENPRGLSAYQLGEERSQYSAERRLEILAEAGGGGAVRTGGRPRARFPKARRFPDPVRYC